jgi:hypothetical protein
MTLDAIVDMTDSLEKFEDDSFNFTNPVKVTLNFDPNLVVGTATLYKEGNNIMARVELNPEANVSLFVDDLGKYSTGEI